MVDQQITDAHGIVLGLTGLEIFFIAATIVSLAFNIVQFLDRRKLVAPVVNTLRALFNDIKSKENNALFVYTATFNPENPHKDISTLKWEYGLYIQSVLGSLVGFKESLVGLLVTLDPSDTEGKNVTRASDYGMTPIEMKIREDYFDHWADQYPKQVGDESKPGDGGGTT